MELLFYLIKVLFLCVVIAVVETVVAKARLFRIKDILGASFVLALIALILTVQQSGLKGLVSP
jgi:formate hydrogenlyase subunit 4